MKVILDDVQEAAEEYVKELDYIDNEHRRMAGNGFLAGFEWGRKWAIGYFNDYRQAYDESIFPPTDMEQFCERCRTATAGRMGRFLLDNCIRDFSVSSGEAGEPK